jgi:hypothetical protein
MVGMSVLGLSGHVRRNKACPFYLQKRTFGAAICMSAKGEKRHGSTQRYKHSRQRWVTLTIKNLISGKNSLEQDQCDNYSFQTQ